LRDVSFFRFGKNDGPFFWLHLKRRVDFFAPLLYAPPAFPFPQWFDHIDVASWFVFFLRSTPNLYRLRLLLPPGDFFSRLGLQPYPYCQYFLFGISSLLSLFSTVVFPFFPVPLLDRPKRLPFSFLLDGAYCPLTLFSKVIPAGWALALYYLSDLRSPLLCLSYPFFPSSRVSGR